MQDKLDKKSPIPLHKQVRDYLLNYIKTHNGQDMLPPELEISRRFGISRATVRIAIQDLVKEGLLKRVPGKGTFIQGKEQTLLFATWLSQERPFDTAVAYLVKKFMSESSGAKIDPIGIPYESIEHQLMVMAAGGKAPDIATLLCPWIPIFGNLDALYPLDEMYTEDVRKRLFPQTIEAVSFKDNIYGFNWINGPQILYYNKNILAEYLGSEQVSLEYYDEFLELSARLHEKSKGKVEPLSIAILDDEIFFIFSIYHFLLAFGGGIINTEGEIVFNSEANIKAYRWLKNFMAKSHTTPTDDFRKNRELFAHNKIAFYIDGPWLKTIIAASNPAYAESMDAIGYTLIPKMPGNPSRSILLNHVLSVFRQCKNKELAMEFIRYMTLNKEVAEYYYKTTGQLPVMTDELENNPVYDDEFGRVLRSQMIHAVSIPASKPAFMLSVTFCAKASREILLGDSDIPSTLNAYADIIKEIYNR